MKNIFLSEKEFKKEVVKWLLKYDGIFLRSEGFTLDDYAHQYKLPDFDYVHLDSVVDDDGDVLTFLKGEVVISRMRSRDFKEHKIIFLHILRTFIDSPEVEPYPMGYSIVTYTEER